MEYESRAISLIYHKYGEGAVIAKVFTEELGLKSYSIKRSSSKKSKNKISLLANQSLLNIRGKENKKREVQYINEINLAYPFSNNNFKKNLIRLFFSEILTKTLMDSEKNKRLFNFVWDYNIALEKAKENESEFILKFIIELSYFLGIYPSTENINFNFFNIDKGVFTLNKNEENLNITGKNLFFFKSLLENSEVSIPKINQRELLEMLFKYYSLHHFDLSNLKSYEIIKSLE